MKIYSHQLDEEASHRLLKSCVVPRPVAWVSTVGPSGVRNLAPFSCYTFVATRPPVICFSIGRKGGEKKDTLVNIENSREFVLNVVPRALAAEVTATAAELNSDRSEWDSLTLIPVASEIVASPRVGECPVAMECRLLQQLEVGLSRHTLVLGEVLLFHIQEEFYSSGVIDVAALDPLARLSDDRFAGLGQIFENPRGDVR